MSGMIIDPPRDMTIVFKIFAIVLIIPNTCNAGNMVLYLKLMPGKSKQQTINIDPQEMIQAGVHFGHKTSRIHPKMQPYLIGVRGGVHIIDTEKTKEKLAEVLEFVEGLIAENKTLVLVGTKVQMGNLVEKIAKECGLPYVKERWLGGTFTNFETISKRIAYYKDLEAKKAAGELEKYTKKERANFDKEIKQLEIKFGGIKDLAKLPEAVFVCDMIKDELAVSEAKAKGVKVIAICDTNTDPTLVDYPIPANDDAVTSIKYILEKVREAILKAKKLIK